MIEVVIVFESMDETLFADTFECDNLKEVEEFSKWYLENRHLKNLYLTFRGEKNEKN